MTLKLGQTTCEELTRRMLDDGYQLGAPAPEVADLDAQIIEQIPCKVCQAKVIYLGFFKSSPRSYRAFGLCPECGTYFEF